MPLYYFDYPKTGWRPPLEWYRNWLTRQQLFTPPVQDALALAEKILKTQQIRGYVAGALTEASEEEKMRYVTCKELAERHRIFLYVPHLFTDPKKHPNVTPKEVRIIDYLFAVIVAQFHVNFVKPIAAGAFIEEGWAEPPYIPSILCMPEGPLSRLPKGMENLDELLTYTDIEELWPKLTAILKALMQWRGYFHHMPDPVVGFFAERKFERGEIKDPIIETLHKIEYPTGIVTGRPYGVTLNDLHEKLMEQGIIIPEDDLMEILDMMLQDRVIGLMGTTYEEGVLVPYFWLNGDSAWLSRNRLENYFYVVEGGVGRWVSKQERQTA